MILFLLFDDCDELDYQFIMYSTCRLMI